MIISTVIFRFLMVSGLAFTLAACSDDGPLEKAGERADETIEDVQNKIEDSCENVKEQMDAKDQDC